MTHPKLRISSLAGAKAPGEPCRWCGDGGKGHCVYQVLIRSVWRGGAIVLQVAHGDLWNAKPTERNCRNILKDWEFAKVCFSFSVWERHKATALQESLWNKHKSPHPHPRPNRHAGLARSFLPGGQKRLVPRTVKIIRLAEHRPSWKILIVLKTLSRVKMIWIPEACQSVRCRILKPAKI